MGNESSATEESLPERHHYEVFKHLPIPVWEIDITSIRRELERVRKEGIDDLRQYLECSPRLISDSAEAFSLLAANSAALELFEVESEEQLRENLFFIQFAEEAFPVWRDGLVAIGEGAKRFSASTVIRTLRGKRRYVDISVSLVDDREDGRDVAVVSFAAPQRIV